MGRRSTSLVVVLATFVVAGALVSAATGNFWREQSAAGSRSDGLKPLSYLDSVDSGRLHTTTFPHDTGRFSAIGKSILIGKGDSPEGAYELAAYAAKTPPGQEHTVGGAKIATCIDLEHDARGKSIDIEIDDRATGGNLGIGRDTNF